MAVPRERRFAGVLARNQGQIILVRESYPAWGGSFWNIPSGRVEADETPAEGAVRELAEEAGVELIPAHLRLVSTSSVCLDGDRALAWNFTAAVNDSPLEVRDPDDLVEEARWFPTRVAAKLLADLPYPPLVDPVLAVLLGEETEQLHWSYEAPDANPVVTPGPIDADRCHTS
jgi:8-oxo-dGTP diphosphatase